MIFRSLAIAGLFLLSACLEEEQGALPPPVTMTEAALGHYCQMILVEHPGPKAQVHLAGLPNPIFFSQVRDAIAYTRMPEQSNEVAAVYVNDMAAAPSWEQPGVDNWIPAAEAFFVVGSDAKGGMGAEEVVPFSDRAAAERFAAERGGRVATLAEIADSDVLAPAATAPGSEGGDDYEKRLKALSHGGHG